VATTDSLSPPQGSAPEPDDRLGDAWRRDPRGAGRYIALGLVAVAVVVVAGVGVALASSSSSLTAYDGTLARIAMPFGGGSVQSVAAYGPTGKAIPVSVQDGIVMPTGLVPANEEVSVDVTVSRPGLISWLTGSQDKLSLQLRTPGTSLREHYLTLGAGKPLQLTFRTPVQTISYGPPGHMTRHVLQAPTAQVTIARPAAAGSMEVAAAPETWESARSALISWFPAGAAATAIASPAPGTLIQPTTPIELTFNKPVREALRAGMPPVSPVTQGSWQPINSHTIVFRPKGYGYGLSAAVHIALPSGVQMVGGSSSGSSSGATWPVPSGSPLRLQELLAELGYLPLRWSGPTVAPDPASQEAAAVSPPAGHFSWRYPNIPGSLRGFWAAGSDGIVTRGALMAFENDNNMTPDGVAGPAVWKALITSAVNGKGSTSGYTYVTVTRSSQAIDVWHSGKTVVTGPVNTGIASRPTDPGTFPVYEHIPSGTMSGTNPDGSHYDDPGIQYISYFNGGDALHAFTRAQYGFPQSLGCVEMPTGEAGSVYPYTPIGTLVHVE
jgi:peptidoglycan hydrolase-like protein with peptidoglycan-binding domain